MFYTGSPAEDAQSYIAMLEKTPYEYTHACSKCEKGFDRGHGVRVTDEKFCNTCIDHGDHYEFYAECGISAAEVDRMMNNYKIEL